MQPPLKSALIALIRRVPAGRVVTFGQLAAELRAAPKLIAPALATLTDEERRDVPWWRVVADGGAIGRHAYRDAQISALRGEGLLVAPAGVVQRLDERRMPSLDVAAVGAGHAQQAALDAGAARAAPSRSRGMKGTPRSSV